MRKEYIRTQIANRRIEIVKLRAQLKKKKEEKAKKMKDLAGRIRTTKIASSKETYRKQKISDAARYEREFSSIKKKIESVQKSIESYKKQLANAK
jgi:hypothetical protein